MFLRRTTYRMAPDHESPEGQQAFEKAMRATVRPQDIEGLISTSHVPNDDGTWSIVAVWEAEEHALAATPRIRAALDSLSDMLAGPPTIATAGVTLREVL